MYRIAYTTLATDQRYLKGAYNLYKSFLSINSKYEFITMVYEDTDLTGYEDLPIRIVPKIYPTNKRLTYNPPIGMFSKICLWLLTEYDFVLFLDSDIILYKNIDYLIDDYVNNIGNEIIIPLVPNPSNAHDTFSSAWIFTKPNKELFLKAINFLNISVNDQEILTYMYDEGILKINNYRTKELISSTFHFNNWSPGKKYWEDELSMKIYDIIINNKNLIPIIEEIQKKIAIQPYERDII